jgi:hypothetical protein
MIDFRFQIQDFRFQISDSSDSKIQAIQAIQRFKDSRLRVLICVFLSISSAVIFLIWGMTVPHTSRIKEDQAISFAFRGMKPVLLIVGGLMIAFSILLRDVLVGTYLVVALPLGLGMLIRSGYVKTIRISILENSIAQTIDKSGTNALIEMSRARNQARHNVKDEKEIAYTGIRKIIFKKNGVRIIGKDYDFFTHNGSITIPRELEHYEEYRDFFEKLAVRMGIPAA